MKKFKLYLKYLENNATDEMKGFIEILLTIVSVTVFAIVVSMAFIYFENILKLIAYIILGLCGVILAYVIIKAIYDFIKLTVNYKR